MCEKRIIAYRGQKFTILWARTEAGQMPALDFFESLKSSDKAKILSLFQRFGDAGRISNKEKFKKVAGEIWEFKSFQLRFLGSFRPGGVFVLASGLRKKKDRHKPKDLRRAEMILAEHDQLK